MLSRPKPGETEEDLLRQQEEFLRTKASPAANVVRGADKRKNVSVAAELGSIPAAERDVVSMGELPSAFSHTSAAPPVKKSRFKEKKSQKSLPHQDNLHDPEARIDSHDTHITKVLANIVERDLGQQPVYYPSLPADTGFPTVLHREDKVKDGTGKKKSLFAQQFSQRSLKDYGLQQQGPQLAWAPTAAAQQEVVMETEETGQTANVPCRHGSSVVTGEGLECGSASLERARIHEENEAKLATMSTEEILAEQKKLLQSLDPSLVSFLRSKRSVNTVTGTESQAAPSQCASSEMAQTPAVQSQTDTMPVDTTPQGMMTDELPVQVDKQWVNMDKVEADKLQWTKDLPPPPKPENNKTGFPARFDLEGRLVAVDETLPTHLGLHHHGKEPERAGYTLEELFQLCRSANMQQRALALNTLAKIIIKARSGSFHQQLSVPLVSALLEGGLVFVLRWALDDSMESSMVASVTALHALLVCQQDEVAADQVFTWPHGAEMPALTPLVEDTETKSEGDEEQAEETDGEVLKRDVVQGLLRMQLLPRLRYILEVWRPGAAVVVHILQILTRIARHSAQAAYQVPQCPRLLDTVFAEFLPLNWKPAQEVDGSLAVGHGYPLAPALKLVRVMGSAGRHMAANIAKKYQLTQRLARYLAEDSGSMLLPAPAAHELQMESLRTWHVLLAYGIQGYTFSEMYPVLSIRIQALTKLGPHSSCNELEDAATLLCVLRSASNLAAAATHASWQKHRGKPASSIEAHDSQPIPELNWSHVTGLLAPIQQCMAEQLQHFTQQYDHKPYDLTFAAACMSFVASVYCVADSQPGYDSVATQMGLEHLCEETLVSCLRSVSLQKSLSSLRQQSLLLHSASENSGMEPANLPVLGALVGETAKPCPLLNPDTTVQFLLALSHLLLAMGKLHKKIPPTCYRLLLGHEDLLLYLRKCCQGRPSTIAHSAFCKFENLLQYRWISMARLWGEGCDFGLLHQVSLRLLCHLHQGDEYLAQDLLATVIFNKTFIGDLDEDEDNIDLDQLHVRHPQLTMATQQVVHVTKAELTTDTLQHLALMRTVYLTAMGWKKTHLTRSQARLGRAPEPLEVTSLQTGPSGHGLVPLDWPFLPLVAIYNHASNRQPSKEEAGPTSLVSMATNCLRWIVLLEFWRPSVLKTISLSTKFSRVMCTFLAGSDLFLDRWVHAYLAALFRLYCQPANLRNMDLSQAIPGISSFYDMYCLLLTQYEAVSFGDSLFACYVLLPQQQRHDLLLRRALWSEFPNVLQQLSIPIQELVMPLTEYMEPEESDKDLLQLYLRALLTRKVTPQRSPLPYLMALHHVNRFMFTQEGELLSLRRNMLRAAFSAKDETLRHELIYYCRPDPDSTTGYKLYDTLPPLRQQRLQQDLQK